MLLRPLVAAALCVLMPSLGLAQTKLAPNDPNNGPTDACMLKSYGLGSAAQKRGLSDTTLNKLDGMFNTMQAHCKARETAQADAVAAKIRGIIDAGK